MHTIGREGRTVYDRVRFEKWRDHPVLLDHDEAQRIGTVLGLYREVETVFGGSTWLVARALLDQPPEWVKRGTPASICTAPLYRSELGGFEVYRECLLQEVSILRAGKRRAEPLARVTFVRDEAMPAGTIVHRRGQVIQPRSCGVVLGLR